jgi:hypothetical protein
VVLALVCVASAGASLLAATPAPAKPQPVPTKADISYGSHPHQVMDLYLPPKAAGPSPVVIWFGGIWESTKGGPDLNALFSINCAAMAVETRAMADRPRTDPPIACVLLDARRVVQFVRLHAAEWNIDPERIALAGGSQAALPALYVACAGERADPHSSDPVERVSTKVTCVLARNCQPSIDPKRMQDWVPGVEWGWPALGGPSFQDTLARRDELLPLIQQWSPDWLLNQETPPIYFMNNSGLTRPEGVQEMPYRVHSPLWALGFQQLAKAQGLACYVSFPGHPSEKYQDEWDFLRHQLHPEAK